MKNWKKTLVSPATSIVDTIKIIDAGTLQIALVVDENNRLLGTVTDGDIRRGILKGISLERAVVEIMHKNPVVAGPKQSREDILRMMKKKKVHQVPLVDKDGRVIGLEILGELLQSQVTTDNWVVIMAGGLGTRLRPLTSNCPKPLLKVGDKPLLETILDNFIEQGFSKFYFTVNFMAEMIKEHFADGAKWGVEINYITEDKRMGTAGAIGLLPEKPEKPLLVMNGDLLTKVNYKQLLDYHHENRAIATMCVREYSFQLPYGIVKIAQSRLQDINEKPVHHFFVNAGMYVLEPEVIDLIPKNTYFDMTTLFKQIIKQEYRTSVFPIREYWIDIGHFKDYEKANIEYGDVF